MPHLHDDLDGQRACPACAPLLGRPMASEPTTNHPHADCFDCALDEIAAERERAIVAIEAEARAAAERERDAAREERDAAIAAWKVDREQRENERDAALARVERLRAALEKAANALYSARWDDEADEAWAALADADPDTVLAERDAHEADMERRIAEASR
jgi:hypothetical protein